MLQVFFFKYIVAHCTKQQTNIFIQLIKCFHAFCFSFNSFSSFVRRITNKYIFFQPKSKVIYLNCIQIIQVNTLFVSQNKNLIRNGLCLLLCLINTFLCFIFLTGNGYLQIFISTTTNIVWY